MPAATAPADLGPPPNAPDTVTVDGTSFVNGQEPRALGTVGTAPPQSASMNAPPPSASAYAMRPYTAVDRNGGAPLPNDVVILPNGQMTVPANQP